MDTREQQLATYLRQLKDATEGGKMSWSQANPTTYVWTALPPQFARVTLQKVARPATPPPATTTGIVNSAIQAKPAPSFYYILQGLDTRTNLTKLVINSSLNPSLNQALADLYSAAADRYTSDSIEFLQSILPK